MADTPNHETEIDELFDHIVNHLDHDEDTVMDWAFAMESASLVKLQEVAEQLDHDEYFVQIQEEVELVDEDGNVVAGNPLLSITRRGSLTPDNVKEIARSLIELANKHGVDYLGVDCYETLDDEVFEWFDLEGAMWQIKHFQDVGLPKEAALPWVFLVESDALKFVHATAEAFTDAGYDQIEVYDEPDDQNRYALCVFLEGTNDDSELKETFEALNAIARQSSSEVVGVQFCSEEELHDSFIEPEDDESDEDFGEAGFGSEEVEEE